MKQMQVCKAYTHTECPRMEPHFLQISNQFCPILHLSLMEFFFNRRCNFVPSCISLSAQPTPASCIPTCLPLWVTDERMVLNVLTPMAMSRRWEAKKKLL